jgi:rhamnosyltransferase subunit B
VLRNERPAQFAVGARLAARAHGFLDTTVHLSPGVTFSDARPPRWPAASIPTAWPRWLQAASVAAAEHLALDPVIRRALAPALRVAGLAKERRMFSRFIHSTHRVVYLFPDGFAAAVSDWPSCGRPAGFGRAAEPVASMPDGVASFVNAAGAPLAVITAGTAVEAPPGGVARTTEVLLSQDLRVLVLGRQASRCECAGDGRLMTAPPSPLSEILPKASLLVHHGGIGTAADALRAGVPQWLFPSAHDQADNAQRLVDLGVGRRFGADAQPAVLAEAAMPPAWLSLQVNLQALKLRLAAEPDGIDRLAEWVMTDLPHFAAGHTRPCFGGGMRLTASAGAPLHGRRGSAIRPRPRSSA